MHVYRPRRPPVLVEVHEAARLRKQCATLGSMYAKNGARL